MHFECDAGDCPGHMEGQTVLGADNGNVILEVNRRILTLDEHLEHSHSKGQLHLA